MGRAGLTWERWTIRTVVFWGIAWLLPLVGFEFVLVLVIGTGICAWLADAMAGLMAEAKHIKSP